jgi:hypothetical protein
VLQIDVDDVLPKSANMQVPLHHSQHNALIVGIVSQSPNNLHATNQRAYKIATNHLYVCVVGKNQIDLRCNSTPKASVFKRNTTRSCVSSNLSRLRFNNVTRPRILCIVDIRFGVHNNIYRIALLLQFVFVDGFLIFRPQLFQIDRHGKQTRLQTHRFVIQLYNTKVCV